MIPTGMSWTLSSIVLAVAGGTLIGGGASIDWTAVANFVIDADFKFVPLAMTLFWASSPRVFWSEDDGRMHC